MLFDIELPGSAVMISCATARVRRSHGHALLIEHKGFGEHLVGVAIGGRARARDVRKVYTPEQRARLLAELERLLPIRDAESRIPRVDLREVGV